MNGAIVIDKPSSITSHDVVRRVRRALQEPSVGHLGTLDPLATGVLPLLLGKLTRLAQFFRDSDKTYEGEIHFGFATDTFDAEGEPVGVPQNVELDLAQLRIIATAFTGHLMQTPPQFSAKKVGGVAAYKSARKAVHVELAPVSVRVEEFNILAVSGSRASFSCQVSAGTYVRSLADGMGRALGVGAHLTALRRTRAGEFGLDRAITLRRLEETAEEADWQTILINPQELLPAIASVVVDSATEERIRHGNQVEVTNSPANAQMVKLFGVQGDLLAIGQRIEGTLYQPKVVLA